MTFSGKAMSKGNSVNFSDNPTFLVVLPQIVANRGDGGHSPMICTSCKRTAYQGGRVIKEITVNHTERQNLNVSESFTLLATI